MEWLHGPGTKLSTTPTPFKNTPFKFLNGSTIYLPGLGLYFGLCVWFYKLVLPSIEYCKKYRKFSTSYSYELWLQFRKDKYSIKNSTNNEFVQCKSLLNKYLHTIHTYIYTHTYIYIYIKLNMKKKIKNYKIY